jgi:hypothetical protein
MQKAESTIGTGQRLDVCILEKETQAMQDVLTRSMPSFYRGLIDTWASRSVRDESSCCGTRRGTAVFTAL